MSTLLLFIAALSAGHTEASIACTRKLDLVLAVDGSSSICGVGVTEPCPKWNAVTEFSKNIVNSLTIGPDDSRVAYLTLSDKAHLQWNLNQYTDKTSLLSAIYNVKYPGGKLIDLLSLHVILTGIFSGIRSPLFNVGDRPSVDNVAILITDGAPEFPPIVYDILSTLLEIVGKIKVFVVCVTHTTITPGCTESCARGIASSPKQANVTYFLVDNYLAIDEVTENLVKQICAS